VLPSPAYLSSNSYEVERRPNVRSVIETTKRLGELICERDPDRAAARDRRMLEEMATGAGRLIRQSPLPPLSDGLLHRGPNGELSVGAGEPALQPWLLLHGGVERRADEVTGVGFRLFLSPHACRNAVLQRCAERLELAVFELAALHDVHGLLAQWLLLRGATAVLVRPDHVVYGTATGTDSGIVLAQALERDLKAKRRDDDEPAGDTAAATCVAR
jgi:3-(3-hydroxy-phenyl)propionate hydroxylase